MFYCACDLRNYSTEVGRIKHTNHEITRYTADGNAN
jgi:hypothetical protein